MRRRSFIGLFSGLAGCLFGRRKVKPIVRYRSELKVGVIPKHLRRSDGTVVFNKSVWSDLIAREKGKQ